jgi:hypothetical protein
MSWLRRTQVTDDGAAALAIQEFGDVVERAFPVDDEALARVRAGVLGAFIDAAPTQVNPVVGRQVVGSPLARRAGRRFAVASAAMVALLAVSTVAVQARPGAPFYAVRLAAESALLIPLDAESGWQARLDRLDRRMTEAVDAGVARDTGAISAALDEYRSEFDGLTADLSDARRRASLIAAATRDLTRLTALQGSNPTDAGAHLTVDLEAFLGVQPTPSTTTPSTETPASPEIPTQPGHANGDPHEDGATGNPHDDGTTGNPHGDGEAGNPHDDGTTGNPHDGTTGNPHSDGSKGDPHSSGTKGDPHSSGTKGDPHQDGAKGNPHPEKPAKPKNPKK